MSKGQSREDVVGLVHAIADSERICQWIFDLEQQPSAIRHMAFGTMVEQMTAGSADSKLISAVSALADSETFDAVCDTLRSLRRDRA